MKIIDAYYHSTAESLFKPRAEIIREITDALTSCPYIFGKSSPTQIKRYVANRLNSQGWTDKVRVSHKIRTTVNFMKSDVAFALQLGNVARTYADLLKIAYLENKGVICLGVIALPSKKESTYLGTNYAKFERFRDELDVYANIIKVPLYVIALGN
jgi:Restriction endonuclease BglII.